MISLMDPIVDPENGFMLYPVLHALGGIVYSFSPESQKLWHDLADKQRNELARMHKRKAA